MAKLYKQYCYVNLTPIRNAIKSELHVEGLGLIDNAVIEGNKVKIFFTDSDGISQQRFITPPNCTTLGFDNSYTGISTADAVEIGGLVTIALVIAYAAKITRRAI